MSFPKVSIVITTYKAETKPYLDLCVKSALELNYDQSALEIIVVCNQFHRSIYDYGPRVKVIYPIEPSFYNPRGLNFGIANASEDSKYYFILNDDVILTKDCLLNLIDIAGGSDIILQPLSPCDNYGAYQLVMGFQHGSEFFNMDRRFYRLNEVEGFTNSMMLAKSVYPVGLLRAQVLCMFATLIPKKVFEKVGKFDENFKTGQDDIDYSKRATQNGVSMMYVLNSLVWHFGGVTADDTITLQKRKENIAYYYSKWKEMPPGMPDNILETLDESYKFGATK